MADTTANAIPSTGANSPSTASPTNLSAGSSAAGFVRQTLSAKPAASHVPIAPAIPGPASREASSIQGAPAPAVAAPPSPQVQAQPVVPAPGTQPQDGAQPPNPAQPDPNAEFQQRAAALARREARLVEENRRYKQETQQREQMLAQLAKDLETRQRKLADFEAQQEAARADPQAWLKLGGHTYDALAAQIANDGKPLPDQQIAALRESQEQALAKIREEQAEAEKARQAEIAKLREEARLRDEQEAQRQIESFNQTVVNNVQASGDKYKSIKALDVYAQVPEVIQNAYRASVAQDARLAELEGRDPVGRVLSWEEAATIVENYYVGLVDKVAPLLGYTKAQQTQAVQQTQVPQVGSSQTSPQSAQASPTLTNQTVAAPSSPASGVLLPESERYRRALAALNAPGSIKDRIG